jgi:DMSO/TMAO reductase YedYZ molybdopterin-dependent catalytic subunit
VSAGVAEHAIDPAYRLVVTGAVAHDLSLTLTDLAALRQTTARLPIACVEGWSAVATWTGVALVDLLSHAGAAAPTEVRVVSLQEGSAYSQSILRAPHVNDPLTLLALAIDGEPLHVDHGYPCRLIAPNRPGVLQTKWITRVEVLA